MSIREKFFQAMRREREDFVPFEFQLCPSLQEKFKEQTGTEDYAAYFRFPVRVIGVPFTGDTGRYKKYFADQHDRIAMISDWGVGHIKGSIAHFTEMQHPMEKFETLEEFAAYPYPDPEKEYDWTCTPEQIEKIRQQDLVSVAALTTTIFETAWYLRGMDNFLIDLAINPELADYHMDRITERRKIFARKYAQAGSDVLWLGDDVSTQLDMMMHPDMWRQAIKPRLAGVIDAAREVKPDILIYYHGDGNLQKIIPDLIEIGVDVLNPVQPECMDPVEVKRLYGDRLSFWGTLGTQTTMPFGTAAQVRETCARMITEVGRGGGLLLAPTHVLEPEVPWENILAFIETVQEYNARA